MAEKKKTEKKKLIISPEKAYLYDLIHRFWINPFSREIWIHGIDMNNDTGYEGDEPGVEYMMASQTIKNLHLLKHEDETKPVIIHLHTCGGLYEEGMAIYNTIRLMPYKTTIISYTHARSMSSIILQAADKRLLMPDSYFMFHYGSLAVDGGYKLVISNVEFTKIQNARMVDIYVEKAIKSKKFKGWTEGRLRKHLQSLMDKKTDVFLTAEQAVEWGFADGVVKKWPNTS